MKGLIWKSETGTFGQTVGILNTWNPTLLHLTSQIQDWDVFVLSYLPGLTTDNSLLSIFLLKGSAKNSVLASSFCRVRQSWVDESSILGMFVWKVSIRDHLNKAVSVICKHFRHIAPVHFVRVSSMCWLCIIMLLHIYIHTCRPIYVHVLCRSVKMLMY